MREQRIVLEHHAEAALLGRSGSMRFSSSQMPPPVAGRRPAIRFSVVDLPQPEGPSRAMNSPLRIVSETSLEGVVGSEIAAEAIELQLAEIGGMYRHGSHAVAGRRAAPADKNRGAGGEGHAAVRRRAGASAGTPHTRRSTGP